MYAWVNGEMVDPTVPHVLLTDHGFTVGDGVFETLPVRHGRAFAVTRHLARLERSAAGMGLTLPPVSFVRDGIGAVAEAVADAEMARLRITYTSGPGAAGSERSSGPGTIVITAIPAKPWPQSTSVAVAPWPRNERSALAGLKTTSYGENAVALAWARQRGHSEALLVNLAGQLCEGTGSNVFVVVDGQVLTPPLQAGCLAGVTRDLVLAWCGGMERDLDPMVLATAQEVFLTSSTRDIHPVHQVDDRRLDIGPITRQWQQEFRARAEQEIDP